MDHLYLTEPNKWFVRAMQEPKDSGWGWLALVNYNNLMDSDEIRRAQPWKGSHFGKSFALNTLGKCDHRKHGGMEACGNS